MLSDELILIQSLYFSYCRILFEEFFLEIVVCSKDPTYPICQAAQNLSVADQDALRSPNPKMKQVYQILVNNDAFRSVVWNFFKFHPYLTMPILPDEILYGNISLDFEPSFHKVFLSSDCDERMRYFCRSLCNFLNRPVFVVYDDKLATEFKLISLK